MKKIRVFFLFCKNEMSISILHLVLRANVKTIAICSRVVRDNYRTCYQTDRAFKPIVTLVT